MSPPLVVGFHRWFLLSPSCQAPPASPSRVHEKTRTGSAALQTCLARCSRQLPVDPRMAPQSWHGHAMTYGGGGAVGR
eukprot:2203460-Pyramimonas_sp.AAC.1